MWEMYSFSAILIYLCWLCGSLTCESLKSLWHKSLVLPGTSLLGLMRSMFMPSAFTNVSFCNTEKIWPIIWAMINDKPEDVKPLPWSREQGSREQLTPAGYALHFTCDLPPSRSGEYYLFSSKIFTGRAHCYMQSMCQNII